MRNYLSEISSLIIIMLFGPDHVMGTRRVRHETGVTQGDTQTPCPEPDLPRPICLFAYIHTHPTLMLIFSPCELFSNGFLALQSSKRTGHSNVLEVDRIALL